MSEKKRILIISDSLALPRSNPEETLYEETYPYLLKKDYEVMQLSYGGGTIGEIVHQAHYYITYKLITMVFYIIFMLEATNYKIRINSPLEKVKTECA